MTTGAHDPRLSDRDHIIVELRHLAGMAIQHFVFQKHYRIGIADCGLEQALGIGGVRRRDHLQAGNVRIPGRIILAVLRGDARCRSVGAAEHDRDSDLPAGHVLGLCG